MTLLLIILGFVFLMFLMGGAMLLIFNILYKVEGKKKE